MSPFFGFFGRGRAHCSTRCVHRSSRRTFDSEHVHECELDHGITSHNCVKNSRKAHVWLERPTVEQSTDIRRSPIVHQDRVLLRCASDLCIPQTSLSFRLPRSHHAFPSQRDAHILCLVFYIHFDSECSLRWHKGATYILDSGGCGLIAHLKCSVARRVRRPCSRCSASTPFRLCLSCCFEQHTGT